MELEGVGKSTIAHAVHYMCERPFEVFSVCKQNYEPGFHINFLVGGLCIRTEDLIIMETPLSRYPAASHAAEVAAQHVTCSIRLAKQSG